MVTAHPPALVRAVADAIVAVAKRYPVPSERTWPGTTYLGAPIAHLAAAALDAADAHRRRTTVETHPDALRLVEDILDAHLVDVGEGHELDAVTGPAIVDALLGDPVATTHYDDAGNLTGFTLDWPSDETRACIVARPVLEHLVELLNRRRPA